ncbi:hypothetical protein ONS96_000633 [Cadophora gregata f. sp. sojae]|nr:hypothetical protein ONS96_000633 [Cadophora gregata f. sp. sojae]
MKPTTVIVAALHLSTASAVAIHISISDEIKQAFTRVKNTVNPGALTFKAGDDGTEEPYGLTIKKSTEADIQAHVTQDFLSKLPSNITFTDSIFDFMSQKNKQSPKGKYNEVDVKIPAVVSCTPRVSEFGTFSEDRYGSPKILHCYSGMDSDGKCRKKINIPVKDTYSPQEYVAIASVAERDSGVSITAKTTYDWIPSYFNPANPSATEWEFTWKPDASQSDGFPYELESESSCMLGMVHVELDCIVETRRYWWDTTWSSSHGWLKLEYQTNRHESSQPYANAAHKGGEQYCTFDWVLDKFWWDSVYEKDMWKPILSSDGYRGFVYLGNGTKLEGARMQNSNSFMGPFRDDEMIVHRHENDKGKRNRIWRCVPARRESQVVNMTIPLKGAEGQLQGYLGCIEGDDLWHGGDPRLMTGGRDSDGEL